MLSAYLSVPAVAATVDGGDWPSDAETAPAAAAAGNTDPQGFDVPPGKGFGVTVHLDPTTTPVSALTATPVVAVQDEELRVGTGVPLEQQVFHLLRFPLRSRSETLRTATRELVRDRDYTINYKTGEVRLLKGAAITRNDSSLYANYTALPSTTLQTPRPGMTATASYTGDNVKATARFRGADPGFSPAAQASDRGVTTTDDQSVEWSTSYAPSKVLSFSASGSDAYLPGASWLNGFDSAAASRQVSNSFAADYHPPGAPSIGVQHSSSAYLPDGKGQGSSSYSSDRVTSSWSKNGLSANVSLDRSTSSNSQPRYLVGSDGRATLSDAQAVYENTTNGTQLGVGYQPNDHLNVGLQLNSSKTDSNSDGTAITSGSKGMQATASYRPGKKVTYTASLQDTTIDAVAARDGIISPAGKTRSAALGAAFQPRKDLEVGVNYSMDNTTTDALPVRDMAFDGTQALAPVSGTRSDSRTTSVNVNYHPGQRTNVSLNVAQSRGKTVSDAGEAANGGTRMQVDASYRAAGNLSFSGNLYKNTSDAAQDAWGTALPAQQDRALSLRSDWQPTKRTNLGVQFSSGEGAASLTGVGKTQTVSADASWQPNARTAVRGYMATQRGKGDEFTGNTQSTLVGVGAQVSPARNVTVGADVQRFNGSNADGVNRLWETEGQARRSIPVVADDGSQPLEVKSMTTVAGNVTYRAGDKHDLALTGEMSSGNGETGDLRRRALGIGWHYHADENLTFSLDARRVKYAGKASDNGGDTNEVAAELTWRF